MNTNTTAPKVVAATAELRKAVGAVRRAGQQIGLVPTMGALHEGHLSLVRAAKADCDFVVVSIFVNPSQFGPSEDFAQYPRTLDSDLAALAGCRADLVFAPASESVYQPDHDTWVEMGAVAQSLEGQFRPIHFRGVATIVLKLLNLVQPDIAYFGQKDYQQAQVIAKMARDLDVPTTIRTCPTVREPDGLAMSSRNRYLSPTARQHAAVLWQSLQRAVQLVAQGERRSSAILAEMRKTIETVADARVDYIAIADADTLQPLEDIVRPAVAALAVHIENTRLIDNCLLTPPADGLP